jgi:hypothetical protein
MAMADDESSVREPIVTLLWQPLSKAQAMVGITAGLISVGGFVFAKAGPVTTLPTQGQLVAIVQEAHSQKPVLDATLEVSAVGHALVTTRISSEEGRVHQTLQEGQYRVRVRHPKFNPESLVVQVAGGQVSELHFALTPRAMPPPPDVAQPVGPTKPAKPVKSKSPGPQRPDRIES